MTTPETCPHCGAKYRYRFSDGPYLFECDSWLDQRSELCRAIERAQKAEDQINELLLLVMPLNSEPDEDGVIHKSTDYPLSWKCEQIRTAIYDMTSEISNLQRTIGDCEAQWHSKH